MYRKERACRSGACPMPAAPDVDLQVAGDRAPQGQLPSSMAGICLPWYAGWGDLGRRSRPVLNTFGVPGGPSTAAGNPAAARRDTNQRPSKNLRGTFYKQAGGRTAGAEGRLANLEFSKNIAWRSYQAGKVAMW